MILKNKYKDLEPIIEALQGSILYSATLSNIENAHTNIWNTLATIAPGHVFKLLTGEDATADLEFFREKNNIDLTIKHGDDTWIIEHKLKDSAKPTQLNGYAQPNCKHVLVTLFEPYGKPKDYWHTTNYTDLSTRLADFQLMGDPQLTAEFQGYKSIVEALSRLAEVLKEDLSIGKYDYVGRPKTLALELLGQIKFDVPYIKYRTSKLTYLLYEAAKKRYGESVVYCGSKDANERDIFVDWKYMNTGPIIDLGLKLTADVAIYVQIQGNSIGYGVEANNFKQIASRLKENEILFERWYKTKNGKNEYYKFGNFAKQAYQLFPNIDEECLIACAIEMFDELKQREQELSCIVSESGHGETDK